MTEKLYCPKCNGEVRTNATIEIKALSDGVFIKKEVFDHVHVCPTCSEFKFKKDCLTEEDLTQHVHLDSCNNPRHNYKCQCKQTLPSISGKSRGVIQVAKEAAYMAVSHLFRAQELFGIILKNRPRKQHSWGLYLPCVKEIKDLIEILTDEVKSLEYYGDGQSELLSKDETQTSSFCAPKEQLLGNSEEWGEGSHNLISELHIPFPSATDSNHVDDINDVEWINFSDTTPDIQGVDNKGSKVDKDSAYGCKSTVKDSLVVEKQSEECEHDYDSGGILRFIGNGVQVCKKCHQPHPGYTSQSHIAIDKVIEALELARKYIFDTTEMSKKCNNNNIEYEAFCGTHKSNLRYEQAAPILLLKRIEILENKLAIFEKKLKELNK